MSSPYKYNIPFKKTSGWYDPEGTWYQISTWCNKTLGPGNWDYYYDSFVFEKESDYMLFTLKWL